MERVLKATEAYLPDATRQAQLEQLGYHLLTNFVVRNAGCSAVEVGRELAKLAGSEKRWRSIIKNMLYA